MFNIRVKAPLSKNVMIYLEIFLITNKVIIIMTKPKIPEKYQKSRSHACSQLKITSLSTEKKRYFNILIYSEVITAENRIQYNNLN